MTGSHAGHPPIDPLMRTNGWPTVAVPRSLRASVAGSLLSGPRDDGRANDIFYGGGASTQPQIHQSIAAAFGISPV